MRKSRRIQNKRDSRVGSSQKSFKEGKERERTEKKRGEDRNKTVYFYFFGIAVLCKENVIRNR
jgi:Flp pilus assembly protein TadB